jgi:hypothetical protein
MRRRAEAPPVSLFPFLSILVCLMGVLAFVMVSVAVLAATNPTVLLPERPEGGESNGNGGKTPVFVECHAEHLRIHPEGTEQPVATLAAPGSDFLGLLDRLEASRDREYVLFAVYPAGIDTFLRARALVEARELELGYEPMLEGWRLDLGSQGEGGLRP